ncbi:MAG: 50S ribosomal protein L9 [candidate division NC10 bacterium]|nr:50S ribosomal protein L9 [candidate division NC10 bacterium]
MKIILLRDVAKLGKAGDCVNVSDGYARNYMIPRKLAVEATPSSLRSLEQKKASGAGERSRAEREAQALAEKLSGLSLTVSRQVGKGDRLFGSVTSKDLSEALAELGIDVDRKKILLDEPIKTLGIFEVPIRLHQAVMVHIRVEVMKA